MPEELPRGWVKTILGEVCAINPRTRYENLPPDHTEVSFVPMAAVEKESGRLDASQIRPLRAVRRGYTPFKEDDVIFAKITPCMENGKIALATDLKNGLAYGSTEFIVLRCYKGLLSRFLLYFLLQPSLRQDAEHQMSGAVGQKRVPANYLFNYEILLPPTHEQERIVAKLDAALSGLERAEIVARRALERIQRYRYAVILAGVTGELTEAWRIVQKHKTGENPENGEALLERILSSRRARWEKAELQKLHGVYEEQKDEKWKSRYSEPQAPNIVGLPELPKEWAWASLEMIGEIGSGISVNKNREVKNAIESPYLRVANVLRGSFDLDEIKTIRIERERTAKYLLEEGDILFTEGGDRDKLGRGWVWEGQIPNCVHQNHVFRTRLIDQSLVYARLVSYWGNTFGQNFFLTHGKQTTNLASISQSVLRKLPVPIPPIAEQSEIIQEVERRLSAADQLVLTLQQQLLRSRLTRQSLMLDAFAGRLVSQDSSDEPASALLERIRNQKVQIKESRKQAGQSLQLERKEESDSMKKESLLSESLSIAWENIGRKADARRLFDEAGFGTDHVVQFYEALRATPGVLTAFQEAAQRQRQPLKPAKSSKGKGSEQGGSFRLIELWLEDFKNLKDYTIRFDSVHSLAVILGANGTGKSNLFEALVIILRDLHEWLERNRWPGRPMNGYRLKYQLNEHTVEVTWHPGQMKRPELTKGPIALDTKGIEKLQPIKREMLPLPRFIFGYYSGPTNRLAEHFLPMKQAHYVRLRKAKADDAETLAELLEQRRFFCAETHHAKYVLLAFLYKDDPKISKFLKDRLRIVGFESALFIIRKPPWARSGSKAKDFWGAKGIMRRVMERLSHYAIAPMVLDESVSYGYRSTTEEHYYFFLSDQESLQSFAAEYEDARTFFLALESTDFSELIYDVKIQVRIEANNMEQIPITFQQLSEGEQQLLMVLGLMRFTKSHQSLVLLDEPDTHLNPHWSVNYLKDLAEVMSDDILDSPEQQSSQILMATHDPLVLTNLRRNQVVILERDPETGTVVSSEPEEDPIGMGVQGILRNIFRLRSAVGTEIQDKLDSRARLLALGDKRSTDQEDEFKGLSEELSELGFGREFRDPDYAQFVRAMAQRPEFRKPTLSAAQQKEQEKIAAEILDDILDKRSSE